MLKKIIFFLCLQILGSHLFSGELIVGVSSNPPFIGYDHSGKPTGLFVELLEDWIQKQQKDLRLVYRQGTFQDKLLWLEKGIIDVIPDIAYSEQRAKKYHFSNENIILTWGQIFTCPDTQVDSFLDLEGKVIAVQKDDFFYEDPVQGLKQQVKSFELTVTFLEFSTNLDVIQAVSHKKADVGLANRIIVDLFAAEYTIIPTSVIFAPVSLRFAFKPDDSILPIIQDFDTYVGELKQNSASLYYELLETYIFNTPVAELPISITVLIIILTAILILAIAWIIILQIKLRQNKFSLKKGEDLIYELLETAPVSFIIADSNGKILYANPLYGNEISGESIYSLPWSYENQEQLKIGTEDLSANTSENPFSLVLKDKKLISNCPVSLLDHQGIQRHILLNGSQMNYQKNISVGVFALQDISEFVSIREKLILSQNNLKGELELNKALLNEIHHRVKNNLQVMISLISMKKGNENSSVKQKLEEIQSYIYAMADVHDLIYRSKTSNEIPIIKYLMDIESQTWIVSDEPASTVEFIDLDEDFYYPMAKAIPLGIFFTELLRISSKLGACHFSCRKIAEDGLEAMLFRLDSQYEQSSRLEFHNEIQFLLSLSKQIDGQLIETSDNYIRFCFKIPLPSREV